MMTLSMLRQRLAQTGLLKSIVKSSAALVAVVAILYFALTRWEDVAAWIEPKTTGTIFVDSPEVYTRERLVNDRYIQDAWLREKLKSLNEWAPSTQFAKLEGTVSKLAAGGAKNEEVQKALADAITTKTSVGPGTEFRLHNAVRELIRQEIVENQLDDRHDLSGNTMFLLKFDAAVVPGSRTSKNAIIEVRISSKSQVKHLAHDQELPIYVNDYYLDPDSGKIKPDPGAQMLSWAYDLFDDWRLDLEQRITAKSKAIYSELVNPETARERLLDDFLYFVRSYQSHLPISQLPICGNFSSQLSEESNPSLAQATTTGVNDLKCFLNSRDGLKALRAYISIYATRSAIEGVVGGRIDSPVYWNTAPMDPTAVIDSAALSGRQIFTLDGPHLFNVQLSQDEIPISSPAVTINPTELFLSIIEADCFSNYISPLVQTANLPASDFEIFSRLVEVPGKSGKQYLVGQIPRPRVLLNRELTHEGYIAYDKSISAILAPMAQRYLANFNISDSNHLDGFRGSLFSRVMYLASGSGRDNAKLASISELITPSFDKAAMGGCGLIPLTVPITYFQFVEGLLDPLPFSYAVLPKYEADIESIETTSLTTMAVSNILSHIKPGESGSDIALELAKQSAANEARSRTTLIGFGYQEDAGLGPESVSEAGTGKTAASKIPVFGWLITPPRSSDSKVDKYRFQPLQKSLSALVSVPAWWREIDVEVKTGWMDRAGAIEYQPCAKDQQGSQPRPLGGCYSYTIGLPVDMQLLDELVVRSQNRSPTIDGLEIPQNVNLTRCQYASIEIPGNKLWRSSVVTLGGQEASRIVVLPNMRGILAIFDEVKVAERNPALTVWTSVGSAKYPGLINVAGPNDCLKKKE